MVKQSGLTPDQVAKLQAGHGVSAAEKREIADQMLQQKMNVSLDELKNLKNMDPAARRAWAQAYTAEAMADAQAKVQGQSSAERNAALTDQARLVKLGTIAREQKALFEKTTALRQGLTEKMRDLDDEAQKVEAKDIAPIDRRLEACREEIQKESARLSELGSANGNDTAEAKRESIRARISELLKKSQGIELERDDALRQLCAAFTPRYGDLLRQYLSWARGAQDGYVQYEELENERFKLQTNAAGNKLIVATGSMGLEEAKACVDLLRSAYKYARQDANRPLDGGPAPDVGAAP